MIKHLLPSQEVLHQLIRYEAGTGRLFWLERGPEHIEDNRARGTWNGRYAGKEAFSDNQKTGYRSGTIFGVRYPAHRVIWKMVTGDEPIEIDHIDGDGLNNRWMNLRNVDHITNSRNTKRHKNNTAGVGGVHRLPSGNWHARIMNGGKRISLGTFPTIAAAEQSRREAERKLGYHANHGR